MRVKKWYDIKPKQGVAISFLKSLYDMSEEMGQALKVLVVKPDVDIKPQIAKWIDDLDHKLIKQSIQEVRYANRKRLQISGGKKKEIEGPKANEETVFKGEKEE